MHNKLNIIGTAAMYSTIASHVESTTIPYGNVPQGSRRRIHLGGNPSEYFGRRKEVVVAFKNGVPRLMLLKNALKKGLQWFFRDQGY